MVSPLDEKKRFIHRISPFTFFLVCVFSALLAGSLLFLITGLIAVALDFGEGILTLLVFVAFLVGFIIPIIMLKRARKAIGRNQPPDALAPKKESRFNRDKETQPEVLQEPKFSQNTATKTQPKEQPQEPKFSENASHARDDDSQILRRQKKSRRPGTILTKENASAPSQNTFSFYYSKKRNCLRTLWSGALACVIGCQLKRLSWQNASAWSRHHHFPGKMSRMVLPGPWL
jgi:energy-coupling factor transporter transmembrane protein EcfT